MIEVCKVSKTIFTMILYILLAFSKRFYGLYIPNRFTKYFHHFGDFQSDPNVYIEFSKGFLNDTLVYDVIKLS